MTAYEVEQVQRLVDLASEQMDPAHAMQPSPAGDDACMCWTHRWRRAMALASNTLGIVL